MQRTQLELKMRSLGILVIFFLVLMINACGSGEPGTDIFEITASQPVNNASNVNVGEPFKFTFSENIVNDESLQANVTVTDQFGQKFSGTIVVENNEIIFTPESTLAYNTLYTVTVDGEISSITGNKIENSFSITFQTNIPDDNIPPKVTSNVPLNDASNIAINAAISVTFSEPVKAGSLIGFELFEYDNENQTPTTKKPASLSYTNGLTATLTPQTDLDPDKYYIVQLENVVDIADNPMATTSWIFTTGAIQDNIAPTFTTHSPLSNELDVPVTRSINISFSEPMDASSISTQQFSLFESISNRQVIGTVTYVNNTATFNILENNNTLSHNTEYIARISGSRDLAGNILEDHDWRFTTQEPEQTPPSVVSIDWPLIPNKTKFSTLNPNNSNTIKIEFSERLFPESVNSNTIQLTKNDEIIPITITLVGNNFVEIKPTAILDENTTYVVIIKTEIKDEELNPLKPINIINVFETGDITPPVIIADSENPAFNSTNAAIRQVISIAFNEPMSTTATQSAFSISPDITGELSINGSTLTFTPSEDYSELTKYSVTISNEAKDRADNFLANSLSWQFTTTDFSAPQILSFSPGENAINQSINQNIILEFNENMDKESVESAFEITPDIEGVFNWTDNVLTFSPSSDLLQNINYQYSVSTFAKNVSGISLENTFTSTFHVGDFSIPVVDESSFIPLSLSLVDLERPIIQVSFSKAMHIENMKNAFSISPNVAGTVNVDGNVVTYELSENLMEEEQYFVSIQNSATDIFNQAIEQPVSWTFTTNDFTNPTATIFPPLLNEYGTTVINPVWSVGFDESLQDPSNDAFKLIQVDNSSDIPISILWNEDNSHATISITSGNLIEQKKYGFSIDHSVLSDGVNAINPVDSIEFTVGDFTNPRGNINSPTLDELGRIPRMPIWTVTFNESMQRNNAAFSLETLDGTPIPLNIAWNSNTTSARLSLQSGSLNSNDEYISKVNNSLLVDAQGNPLDPVGSLSITVGDFLAPSASVNPPAQDNLNRISTRPIWTVLFDESITQRDADAFSLLKKEDNTAIPLAVEWNTDFTLARLSIFSSSLEEEEAYIFSIENSLLGDDKNILNPFTPIEFTVGDFTNPTGVINSPTMDGLNRIPTLPTFTVTFSEAIVPSDNGILLEKIDGTNIPLTISWNAENTVATASSINSLDEQQEYVARVNNFLFFDVIGNPLDSVAPLNFTIGDFTPPQITSFLPKGNDVPRNTTIQIQFNEDMDETSIQSSDLTITPPINGTFVVGKRLILFIPDSDLTSTTDYDIAFNNSAKDISQNQLLSGQNWLFTTSDYIGPVATINQPTPDSKGRISVTPVITIDFNEPVNTLSNPFHLLDSINSTEINLNVIWKNNRTQAELNILSGTLLEQTLYEMSIENLLIEDDNGNKLTTTSPISFTTGDFTSPIASLISPNKVNNQIPQTPRWAISFDEPVTQDNTAFHFNLASGGSDIPLRFTWDSTSTYVDISLLNDVLNEVTDYQFSIDNALIFDEGNYNNLATFSIPPFRIGDFTNPTAIINAPAITNGGASLTPTWNVNFSEPVQQDDSAFSLVLASDNTIQADLSVNWNPDSTIATLTLNSGSLVSETQYVSNVDNSLIYDVYGNQLDPVSNLTITTGDFEKPVITIFPPTQDELNRISIRPVWLVTFSESVIRNNSAFNLLLDTVDVPLNLIWNNDDTAVTVSIESGLLQEQTNYTFTVDHQLISDAFNNAFPVDPLILSIGDFTSPLVNNIIATSDPIVPGRLTQQPNITITFNEDMLSSSMVIGNFTFQQGTTDIPFSLVSQPDAKTIVFTPNANLLSNTPYTFTVTTGVKDAKTNALETAVPKTINIGDYTAPLVDSIVATPDPVVPGRLTQQPNITVTFNEDMLSSSMVIGNFTFQQGTTDVPFSLVSQPDARTIVFTPNSNLASNTPYTFTVTTGVKDAKTNALETAVPQAINIGDYTAPVPTITLSTTDGFGRLPKQPVITVTFANEDMNPDTMVANSFTLTNAGTPVVFSVVPNSVTTNSIQLKPNADLLSETDYIFTATSALLDDNGNAINPAVSHTINIGDYSNTSLLLSATGGSIPGDPPTLNGLSILNYHATGLANSARYTIKLTPSNSADFDLATFSDAFSTISCSSTYTGSGDEYCSAKASPTGELYITIVNNDLSSTQFTLTLSNSSEIPSAIGKLTTPGFELMSLSTDDGAAGIVANTEYYVAITGTTDNLDLYSFNGDPNITLTNACTSVLPQNNISEYCELTSTGTTINLLVDGSNSAASASNEVDYVGHVLPIPQFKQSYDATVVDIQQSGIVLSGTTISDYFKITGLSPTTTYQVKISNITDALVLQTFDDPFFTESCSSNTIANTAECFSLPHANGDLYFKTNNSVSTIYLDITEVSNFTSIKVPSNNKALITQINNQTNPEAYFRFSRLAKNEKYIIMAYAMDTDINIKTYDNDNFTNLICTSDNDTGFGKEICTVSANGKGEIFLNTSAISIDDINANYSIVIDKLIPTTNFDYDTVFSSNGSQSYQHFYAFEVSNVPVDDSVITLNGLSDNFDLHVYSDPFITPLACNPISEDASSEICNINLGSSSNIFVLVEGFSATTNSSFSLGISPP